MAPNVIASSWNQPEDFMRDPKSPLRISDPDGFGEVTLVPALAPGRTRPDTKRDIQDLHEQVPQSPLAQRAAALNTLMRRPL
jgi:hypothetical protein